MTSPGRSLTSKNVNLCSVPSKVATFGLEGDRVMELLGKGTVSEDEQAEIIGTLCRQETSRHFEASEPDPVTCGRSSSCIKIE